MVQGEISLTSNRKILQLGLVYLQVKHLRSIFSHKGRIGRYQSWPNGWIFATMMNEFVSLWIVFVTFL